MERVLEINAFFKQYFGLFETKKFITNNGWAVYKSILPKGSLQNIPLYFRNWKLNYKKRIGKLLLYNKRLNIDVGDFVLLYSKEKFALIDGDGFDLFNLIDDFVGFYFIDEEKKLLQARNVINSKELGFVVSYPFIPEEREITEGIKYKGYFNFTTLKINLFQSNGFYYIIPEYKTYALATSD